MARDILETARKLRRLATSPNPHEAARAQEKYQDYTTQHQIREDELVELPTTAADILRFFEAQQRRVQAWQAQWDAGAPAVRAAQADSERHEIEYLRHLPRAKRDEKLRQLPPQKQAEYQREFERLRQASRSKRRTRRVDDAAPVE